MGWLLLKSIVFFALPMQLHCFMSYNPFLIPETPTGLQLPPFVSLDFRSHCNFLKVLTWCSLSQPRFTVILQRGRSNKKQEKVPDLVSPDTCYIIIS